MRALSRKVANRKSTLRNLATSLILAERITTTVAKAKELKPIVEHLINSARPGDLNGRRKLLAYLFDTAAVKKTIDELLPRFANVPTGFIKSYKTGPRKGDGAMLMILEFQKAKETKPSDKKLSLSVKTEQEIVTKEENANSKKVAGAKSSTTTKKTK